MPGFLVPARARAWPYAGVVRSHHRHLSPRAGTWRSVMTPLRTVRRTVARPNADDALALGGGVGVSPKASAPSGVPTTSEDLRASSAIWQGGLLPPSGTHAKVRRDCLDNAVADTDESIVRGDPGQRRLVRLALFRPCAGPPGGGPPSIAGQAQRVCRPWPVSR